MTPPVATKVAGKSASKTFSLNLPGKGLSLIALKCAENTVYYYRVRAVNKKNQKGKFSEQFCGRTREV